MNPAFSSARAEDWFSASQAAQTSETHRWGKSPIGYRGDRSRHVTTAPMRMCEKKAEINPLGSTRAAIDPIISPVSEPEAAVRAMEESWEAAIQKRDFKTIGDLIAPDFAGVSEENKLTTRSSLLARAKKDSDTYTSTSIKGLKVHVYGPSTVVAIGDSLEKGTSKDGKPFDRTYRFTDTWVNRNGQWQCVAEQVTQTAGSRP